MNENISATTQPNIAPPGTPVAQPATRDSGLPPAPTPPRRGGQTGNQNALKHGYYAKRMTARERRLFEAAAGIGGTAQETTVLRYKLAEMLDADKPDVALIAKLISLINRLEKDRKVTSANSGNSFPQRMRKLMVYMARCPNAETCGRIEEGFELQQQGVDLEEITGGPSTDPFHPEKVPGNDSF